MSLSKKIEDLFNDQIAYWPMAGENYDALKNVLVRTIRYNNHEIRLQFNPKRIISSAAKVDPKSISERPCFLCSANRPGEQTGIPYLDKYLVLVNPYPIFSRHLTIPTLDHLPQRITGKLNDMLLLAADLPEYTIIYNGPNCGASAPDHFHFQAICRNLLPVEKEYEARLSDINILSHNTGIFFIKDYLRSMLTLRSADKSGIAWVFETIFKVLSESLSASDEPMMNILTWYDDGKWIIHIFPRKRHRPSQYFETGEKKILLSPASIDMGGVLIMPRESDYEKITKDDISDILDQVSVDEFFMSVLTDRLKKEL